MLAQHARNSGRCSRPAPLRRRDQCPWWTRHLMRSSSGWLGSYRPRKRRSFCQRWQRVGRARRRTRRAASTPKSQQPAEASSWFSPSLGTKSKGAYTGPRKPANRQRFVRGRSRRFRCEGHKPPVSGPQYSNPRGGRFDLSPPVTPGGFFCNIHVCLSGRMTNSSYFLPGLLTGHVNAISGRVGVVQFPKASLDPRLQNI
jgi:hypothetical protein